MHPRGRAPGREPLGSPGLFAVIGLLYVFSIPWWFPAGEPGFFFGMPTWALASLGCTLAISGLTAFLALRRWDDDFDEPHPDPPADTGPVGGSAEPARGRGVRAKDTPAA